MKTTPILNIPYPEPGDNTRTWEYWQAQAERIEAILTAPGKWAHLGLSGPGTIVGGAAAVALGWQIDLAGSSPCNVVGGGITFPQPGNYEVSYRIGMVFSVAPGDGYTSLLPMGGAVIPHGTGTNNFSRLTGIGEAWTIVPPVVVNVPAAGGGFSVFMSCTQTIGLWSADSAKSWMTIRSLGTVL